MWLSKQMKPSPQTADVDLGVTTIAGDAAGVITRGEVRRLPIYGPGGYVWLPENGETVLVIKGGPGGEEYCVAGARQKDAPEDLQPGEVLIHGMGDSAILLRRDGSIELRGEVAISGGLSINGTPYRPCTCGGDNSGT